MYLVLVNAVNDNVSPGQYWLVEEIYKTGNTILLTKKKEIQF